MRYRSRSRRVRRVRGRKYNRRVNYRKYRRGGIRI